MIFGNVLQTLCLCSGARFETIFHNFWEYAKIAQTLYLCSGARQEHVQKDEKIVFEGRPFIHLRQGKHYEFKHFKWR